MPRVKGTRPNPGTSRSTSSPSKTVYGLRGSSGERAPHLETRCKQPRVNLGREREAESRLLWLRAALSLKIHCLRGRPPTIRRRGSRRLLPGSLDGRAAVLYDWPESPQFPEVLNKTAVETLRNSNAGGPAATPRRASRSSFENEVRGGWQKEGGERANRRGESEFRLSFDFQKSDRQLTLRTHVRECVRLRDLLRGIVERNQPRGTKTVPYRVILR